MPSDRKPSTDQVLTNTSRGFGVPGALRVALGDMHALDAEALRDAAPFLCSSALAALSPRSAARLTSACLTNQETMPGLAPQQETAVVRRDCARRSASTVSRRA